MSERIIREYQQLEPAIWNNGPQTGYYLTIEVNGKPVRALDYPSPSASEFSKSARERGICRGGHAALYEKDGKLWLAPWILDDDGARRWPSFSAREVTRTERHAALLGCTPEEFGLVAVA